MISPDISHLDRKSNGAPGEGTRPTSTKSPLLQAGCPHPAFGV